MYSVEFLADMLTIAIDGRPCSLTPEDGRFCTTVYSDDRRHHIQFYVTEEELMGEGFKERMLEPALRNLDCAAFPDRVERSMAAIRRTARHVASLP